MDTKGTIRYFLSICNIITFSKIRILYNPATDSGNKISDRKFTYFFHICNEKKTKQAPLRSIVLWPRKKLQQSTK